MKLFTSFPQTWAAQTLLKEVGDGQTTDSSRRTDDAHFLLPAATNAEERLEVERCTGAARCIPPQARATCGSGAKRVRESGWAREAKRGGGLRCKGIAGHDKCRTRDSDNRIHGSTKQGRKRHVC